MNWARGVVVISIALATACASTTQPAEAVKGGTTAVTERRGQPVPEVQVWGALRAVMHEGKTEGKVALQSIVPGPHSYAVGALSELRGEVTGRAPSVSFCPD